MKAAESAGRAILDAIASGEFPIGSALPAEKALAERLGVSRLTVREAVSALAASGVLEVQQGRRNRIADTSRWSVLDPDVVAVRARVAGDSAAVVAELMEARRVLEIGIARLAATRISEQQIAELEETIATMRDEIDGDVDVSARADIRFHEVIVEAAGNPFLSGAFAPLQQMLLAVRLRTAALRPVRIDAIGWHARILEALREGDAEATAAAMSGHMDQTVEATGAITLVGEPDEGARARTEEKTA